VSLTAVLQKKGLDKKKKRKIPAWQSSLCDLCPLCSKKQLDGFPGLTTATSRTNILRGKEPNTKTKQKREEDIHSTNGFPYAATACVCVCVCVCVL
jgi:hypothetical protein